LVIVLAGSALAQAAPIPTTIVSLGSFEGPPDRLGFHGYLQTTEKCGAGRVVKLLFSFGLGVFLPVDQDKSSQASNWAVSGGNPAGLQAVRIVVPSKKYGPRGHRHTCQGDQLTMLIKP
jgi:hypothetical protein